MGLVLVVKLKRGSLMLVRKNLMIFTGNANAEFAKEVAELMKSAFAKIDELTEEVKKLKTEKESKFSAEAKSGANKESKLTISEMIKLKK